MVPSPPFTIGASSEDERQPPRPGGTQQFTNKQVVKTMLVLSLATVCSCLLSVASSMSCVHAVHVPPPWLEDLLDHACGGWSGGVGPPPECAVFDSFVVVVLVDVVVAIQRQ